MKFIVIQDTYVSGTPVFAGDTLVLNNRTRVEHGHVTVGKPELANLKLANRVVSFAEADDAQVELAEKRAARLEKIFAEQDEAAELAEEAARNRRQNVDDTDVIETAPRARAPRANRTNKPASQQTNPEGAA